MWSQSEEKGKVWCFSQDLKTDCAGKRNGVLGRGTSKAVPDKGIKVWQKWDTLRPPSCFNFWNAEYVVVLLHATEWALTPGERMREWAGSSQGFQGKKDKGWEKKCSSGLPLPAAAVCESNPHVLGTKCKSPNAFEICKCFLEDVWYRPMKNGAGEEAGAKL